MEENWEEQYRISLEDPQSYWATAAQAIDWYRPWDAVLDSSNPPFYRWFKGGELNSCYNALDRHVERGRGDQKALIYDSPVTETSESYTFRELLYFTEKFSGVLAAHGVLKGDRVIIYMPMIPQAVIAMLACARLGAVHSVVFGGFAAHELAVRIDDAKPKVIVSASCGIEPGRLVKYKPLLDGAIEEAEHKPDCCIIYQRSQEIAEFVENRDFDWIDEMARAVAHPCVSVAAEDPLYILYTSGTTGQPKGVLRDNGGHAVALTWSMKNVYGVEPGEVYWAASDIGWVVGHSYIVYGPLFNGNTTILFEGKPVGTPDAGAFWRVLGEHNVSVMFTAPTAFRAIKRDDPEGKLTKKYDLTNFRTLFLAGERSDSDTLEWAERHLKVPVIDHWWQTETGWAISANCIGLEKLPVKHGSATKPVPGWKLCVLNETGEKVTSGEIGALSVELPLPPGALLTLYNADNRYIDSYLAQYPGYYETADAGYIDEDGYVFVMARTDDIINTAGHRLSTGAMEEVLTSHPDVAECAVIGVKDDLKGQVPLGFLVLNSGVTRETYAIESEVVDLVRRDIGPVASFKLALTVKRLPKTRSGKVLRGTMQKIADGEDFLVPATIDDPIILDEIKETLEAAGFPRT
ncbi:MAG: propionyl-CoA synthetase [Rhodospirillaceae bacterium]